MSTELEEYVDVEQQQAEQMKRLENTLTKIHELTREYKCSYLICDENCPMFMKNRKCLERVIGMHYMETKQKEGGCDTNNGTIPNIPTM